MSDKTFQFRLVSPEAELMTEMVTDVSAPGTEGDFGVKVGHMAMITKRQVDLPVDVESSYTKAPSRSRTDVRIPRRNDAPIELDSH